LERITAEHDPRYHDSPVLHWVVRWSTMPEFQQGKQCPVGLHVLRPGRHWYRHGAGKFNYVTNALQTYTIPAGVTVVDIEARGAQGGTGLSGTGRGASMKGTFNVYPGLVFVMLVGQQGTNENYNGGGGGGGTFVVFANNTPIIVAGGGGGGMFHDFLSSAPLTIIFSWILKYSTIYVRCICFNIRQCGNSVLPVWFRRFWRPRGWR
jgi:hypothetical protein